MTIDRTPDDAPQREYPPRQSLDGGGRPGTGLGMETDSSLRIIEARTGRSTDLRSLVAERAEALADGEAPSALAYQSCDRPMFVLRAVEVCEVRGPAVATGD